MEKALWQRAAINLLLAGSLAGSATSVTAAEGDSWASRLMFWKSDAQQAPAESVGPDFSKNYTAHRVAPEFNAAHAPVEIAPPVPEQSGWSKFTSAVSGTSSKAVESVRSVFGGDDDEAAEASHTSQSDRPNDRSLERDSFVMLAETMERAGNLPGAAKQYELGLKVNKDSLPALLGYARLQDRQGNFAAAVELYERAGRAHPREAAVYNDVALCLSRQGRKEEAAAKMNQAVKLQPERKLYRNNLAKLLVDVGEPAKALEHLTAAHPPAVAHYNLGYLLAQQGDRPLAARHFAKAHELDASLVDARRWLDTLSEQSSVAATGPMQSPAAAATARYPQQPAASAGPQPTQSDAGPQLASPQETSYQRGGAALPQVLRPNTLSSPRYGMAPTPFSPPSQY